MLKTVCAQANAYPKNMDNLKVRKFNPQKNGPIRQPCKTNCLFLTSNVKKLLNSSLS